MAPLELRSASSARVLTRFARRANPVAVAQLMADCDMDYQFELGLHLILGSLERSLKKNPNSLRE